MSGPLMWMLDPVFTPEVIRSEGLRLGFISVVQVGLDEDHRIQSYRLGDLQSDQWQRLRDACCYRVGIPDWDAYVLGKIAAGAWFKRWKADRLAWQRRRGIDPMDS